MGEGVVAGVLDALIKDFTGEARHALRRADGHGHDAQGPARARCRPTAAPPCRTTPTGPCSAATGPTTTCAWSAATCSRTRWTPTYMTYRVRVRCGRCTTVNVVGERPAEDPRKTRSAEQRARRGGARRPRRRRRPGPRSGPPADGPWPARRGRAARRGRRARAAPAEAEALGRQPARRGGRCGGRARGTARRTPRVEAERGVGAVELQRGQAERGEVRGAVDLDHGAGGGVDEVERQEQVLARGVQHRDVAAQPA